MQADSQPAPRKDQARRLTEEIRQHEADNFELRCRIGTQLRQVEWRLLGYKSFAQYVRTEFDISGGEAKRLMAMAELRPKLPELR
jgi:hypothetical protein